jgi:hypothetical protein
MGVISSRLAGLSYEVAKKTHSQHSVGGLILPCRNDDAIQPIVQSAADASSAALTERAPLALLADS